MELTEFLLARVAEDETAIRSRWNAAGVTDEAFWGTPLQPSRALAECEAKRRIVAYHWNGYPGSECDVCEEYGPPGPCRTLLLLALPYVDHPDFDPE